MALAEAGGGRGLRVLCTAGATVALLAVLAGPALAAQRFVVPGTPGGDCSQPSPCDLATGVQGAQGGDEVILAGGAGDYLLPDGIAATNPIVIHGQAGQPRPRIMRSGGSAPATLTLPNGSTANHLEIDDSTPGEALHVGAVLVDDVLASAAGTGIAVAAGAIVRDSVVTGAGTGVSITGNSAQLRNLTVSVGGAALSVSGTGAAVRNTILRGSPDLTASAPVDIDYSDWRPPAGGGGGVVPGAHDISAEPVFVGPGDFHEAAGAPTIDAGTTDMFTGTFDPDGNPRSLGAAPDIGAYEFVPPPPPPPPAETTPPPPKALLPPSDTTPPHVTLSGRRIRLSGRRASIVLTCPRSETEGCSGLLTLIAANRIPGQRGRRHVIFGTVRFSLRAGTSGRVGPRLSASRTALVRRLRRIVVRVEIVAHDAAGNEQLAQRRFTLVA